MKKYKVILSDAGDILFDTRKNKAKRMAALVNTVKSSGINMGHDELYSKFYPFKSLSQTVISEKEAMEMFFKSIGIKALYDDYLAEEKNFPEEEMKLYRGAAALLENLHNAELPFVILTNASKSAYDLNKTLERMLMQQVKEEGNYGLSQFNFKDYIHCIVSSRDIGIKKPDPYFFQMGLNSVSKDISNEDALFIAHKYSEVFGAAALGIDVMAFNISCEKDAGSIKSGIIKHNRNNKSRIYSVSGFSEIEYFAIGKGI